MGRGGERWGGAERGVLGSAWGRLGEERGRSNEWGRVGRVGSRVEEGEEREGGLWRGKGVQRLDGCCVRSTREGGSSWEGVEEGCSAAVGRREESGRLGIFAHTCHAYAEDDEAGGLTQHAPRCAVRREHSVEDPRAQPVERPGAALTSGPDTRALVGPPFEAKLSEEPILLVSKHEGIHHRELELHLDVVPWVGWRGGRGEGQSEMGVAGVDLW